MAVKIELPENENINEAKVVQENGKRNSALLTANVGTSGLILPEKENVDEAVYVDSNGKRHKVKMVATIYGGGSSDSHNKGWFATPTALRTAHPEAEDGDYAIVGSTDTVWVWDSDDSDWSDSGSGGAVESVNGKTGTVVLDGTDIDAVVDEESDTIEGHLQSLKGGIDLISDEVDTKITNPTGGTAGQYLKKTSSGEEWADVEAGSSKVVITLTGESGTLTSEQIAQVLDDTSVLEILNGGKVFRLSNKNSTVTYRTFISSDCALSENMAFEAIYVQLNPEAANYGAWSLEEVSTGGGSGAVESVNGQTGVVVLDAEDVDALPISGGTLTGDINLNGNKLLLAKHSSDDLTYIKGDTIKKIHLGVKSGTTDYDSMIIDVDGHSMYSNSIYGSLGRPSNKWSTVHTEKINYATVPTTTGTVVVSTNDSTATAGMVLTKTASGAEWATVSGGGAVDSVNGQTGTVVLDADDVNAIPTDGGTLSGELTVSDGTDDCGYIYGEDGGLTIDANGDLYIGCTTGQGIIEGSFELNGNIAKSSSSSDWDDIGDNDLVTKSEVDLVLGDLETLINAL